MHYFLFKPNKSMAHPTRNPNPPIGVIGPKKETLIPVIEDVDNRYKEPEKSIMPVRKALQANFFIFSLKLGNANKPKMANVWIK